MTRGVAPDDVRCTAKSKRTRKRCKRKAVAGKDKCRHHGGATPIKHGKYSKYGMAHPELRQRILTFLKDKNQLVNIENDIAVLRAVVDLLLQKVSGKTKTISLKRLIEIKGLADVLVRAEREIVNAIEKMNKIQHGETHTIKLESVQLLTEQIIEVINQEVPDERTRARIAERLEKLRS